MHIHMSVAYTYECIMYIHMSVSIAVSARFVTAFTTSDFGAPESELVRDGMLGTVLCAGSTRATLL